MEELSALQELYVDDMTQPQPCYLDPLYRGLAENLHLEIKHHDVQYLLSPTYAVLHPAIHPALMDDFIANHRQVLDLLKPLLIRNLLAYSFLVERHSYYLQQNHLLMIARIKERDANNYRYEIRYYTNAPDDLVPRYSDKIYIGRDFVNLRHIKRPKSGLEDHIQSLLFEIEALNEKATQKLHQRTAGIDNFLGDIESIGDEFLEHGMTYLESLPLSFVLEESHDRELLVDFLRNARHLKHFLVEIDSDLEELTQVLRLHDELDFARYVIKFRTDVQNLTELINVKVIARGIEALQTLPQ